MYFFLFTVNFLRTLLSFKENYLTGEFPPSSLYLFLNYFSINSTWPHFRKIRFSTQDVCQGRYWEESRHLDYLFPQVFSILLIIGLNESLSETPHATPIFLCLKFIGNNLNNFRGRGCVKWLKVFKKYKRPLRR